MKEYKVPVQSLIDHIKTAQDVDPWAKEMAEEILKKQIPLPSEVEGGGSKSGKRLIDVGELMEELGISDECCNCKKDSWKCSRDDCNSLYDFCIRFNDAVDAVLERHKDNSKATFMR